MTKLLFSGEFYSGEDCLFTEPGEVEVRDEKAEQLLRDFPDQFSRITPSEPERVEKDEPEQASRTEIEMETEAPAEVNEPVADPEAPTPVISQPETKTTSPAPKKK